MSAKRKLAIQYDETSFKVVLRRVKPLPRYARIRSHTLRFRHGIFAGSRIIDGDRWKYGHAERRALTLRQRQNWNQ